MKKAFIILALVFIISTVSANDLSEQSKYDDKLYRYELTQDEGLFSYSCDNNKSISATLKAIELHHAIIAREITLSDKFCDIENGFLVYTAIIPVISSVDVMRTDFTKCSIVIHCTDEKIEVTYKAGTLVGKPNTYLSRISMRSLNAISKKMANQLFDSLNIGYQESFK